MMNDNLIGFLLGNTIKIVDDYYDLELYDKKFIEFVKLVGFLILMYWNNLGFEYNFIFVLEVIICFFAKQIDNDFYKKISIYIIIVFISYLLFYKKPFFTHNFNASNIFLYFVIAFFMIIIENKLFKEEVGLFKLISRIGVIIVATLIFLFNKKSTKLVDNFTSLFIGYFVISILNIFTKLFKQTLNNIKE